MPLFVKQESIIKPHVTCSLCWSPWRVCGCFFSYWNGILKSIFPDLKQNWFPLPYSNPAQFSLGLTWVKSNTIGAIELYSDRVGDSGLRDEPSITPPRPCPGCSQPVNQVASSAWCETLPQVSEAVSPWLRSSKDGSLRFARSLVTHSGCVSSIRDGGSAGVHGQEL